MQQRVAIVDAWVARSPRGALETDQGHERCSLIRIQQLQWLSRKARATFSSHPVTWSVRRTSKQARLRRWGHKRQKISLNSSLSSAVSQRSQAKSERKMSFRQTSQRSWQTRTSKTYKSVHRQQGIPSCWLLKSPRSRQSIAQVLKECRQRKRTTR